MRTTTLAAALTLLLAGCGFDPAPTAPDDTGLPVREPALDFPEPQFATAVTNSWTTKAAMPTARAHLAAGVVNGVLYAVGGTPSVAESSLATVEGYTPSSNSWATKAPLPAARSFM